MCTKTYPQPLHWNGYKWHFLSSASCGWIFQMRPVWLHTLSAVFSVCMQMAAWLPAVCDVWNTSQMATWTSLIWQSTSGTEFNKHRVHVLIKVTGEQWIGKSQHTLWLNTMLCRNWYWVWSLLPLGFPLANGRTLKGTYWCHCTASWIRWC
jgi:hypothetical protein